MTQILTSLLSTSIVSSFRPSQISGCRLWLDGTDPLNNGGSSLPSNGASLTTWFDKSGAARNVTQATPGNRPTFSTTAAINGKPVIRFATTSELDNAGSLLGGTGQYTRIALIRIANPALSFTQMIDTNGISSAFFFSGDSGFGLYHSGIFFANAPATLTANQVASLVGTYNGTTGILYRNNVQVGSGATATGFTDTPFTIGLTGDASIQDFGEILVYNRALTQSELTQIGNYFKAKWGVGN